jgi:hypothetical protein
LRLPNEGEPPYEFYDRTTRRASNIPPLKETAFPKGPCGGFNEQLEIADLRLEFRRAFGCLRTGVAVDRPIADFAPAR